MKCNIIIYFLIYFRFNYLLTNMATPHDIVMGKSRDLSKNHVQVDGYDFNDGINYDKLLDSYATTGFQATNFGAAITQINKMVGN